MEDFFGSMPADSGAAFVVLQQMSPDSKHLTKERLEQRTPMAVKQVQVGTAIQPNTVYWIPPHHTLIVKDGILRLVGQHDFPRQQPDFPVLVV